MHTAASEFTGRERRRHYRVVGRWPVRVSAVELSGAMSDLDARALNISMGGLLLEADQPVQLWVDKVVQVAFEGAGGAVPVSVRRFLSYGEEGAQATRWGFSSSSSRQPSGRCGCGSCSARRAAWARRGRTGSSSPGGRSELSGGFPGLRYTVGRSRSPLRGVSRCRFRAITSL